MARGRVVRMLLLLLGLWPLHGFAAAQPVVLLHGLARSAGSLDKLEARLQQAGYTTCNVDYPSTRYPVETLVREHVLPAIRACVGDAPATVHFVTHSMGGILVRQLRRSVPDLPVGRVVMLGPPNHGSELVDRMGDWRLFRWINGPAGQQLRTGPKGLPAQLGPADFELGIIAGDAPFLEPFTGYIAGPSDGKVSLESARLEGMKGYLVLPVTHSLMMRDPLVIDQAVFFLQHGQFKVPESHVNSP